MISLFLAALELTLLHFHSGKQPGKTGNSQCIVFEGFSITCVNEWGLQNGTEFTLYQLPGLFIFLLKSLHGSGVGSRFMYIKKTGMYTKSDICSL